MKRIKLKISIDDITRRIEHVNIEGRKLNPDTNFDFDKGRWVLSKTDFPLEKDEDIDIIIIVAGNPKDQSKMKVYIDDKLKGEFKTYKPFNKNGYAIFDEEL